MNPKKIRLVTSMSRDMFDQYGKAMLESVLEHWDVDEVQVYYVGSENKPRLKNKKLTTVNLNTSPGFTEFHNATAGFPLFRGEVQQQHDYRFNVHTFAIKAFAQLNAAVDFDGILVWLDADTRTVAKIDRGWIRCAIRDKFMAYLGRPGWHSCASFVAWDCSHPQNVPWWTNLLDLLISGRFMLLPEWHDSYWNDALRQALELDERNLAEHLDVPDGPANVFDIVFHNRAYHYKGQKKKGPQRYAQLIELVRQLKPDTVVEVGTWNGGRAYEMAQAAPGLRYIGFDLFEQATPETDDHEKNVKPHFTRADVQAALIDKGVNASLVGGNTNETMPQFVRFNPDVKADLIYIDGGHAVETIRSDYENAKKMIKPGGVIVFDDYYVDMPEEDLEKWGANKVLEGEDFDLLPIIDPVKGGGGTQLAVVRC